MITINGVTIPTPSAFSCGIMDITEANRNANGLMIAERIATKRKLELSWAFLSQSDLSSLLGLFTSSFFVTVVYPDPVTGANRSGTFYPGDRSSPMYDYNGGVPRYKDFKFNLVER